MFIPKYLNEAQVKQLYEQALAQMEAQVASAWMNYVLNPEDEPSKAAYEQASKKLAALEKDMSRCLSPAPPSGSTTKQQ